MSCTHRVRAPCAPLSPCLPHPPYTPDPLSAARYDLVSDPIATEGDATMQKIIDALPTDCEEAGPECRT